MVSQSSNCVRRATPLLIQWSGETLGARGKCTINTKFVEWPVVDNVPLLSEVLYTGHSYLLANSASFYFLLSIGCNIIYGISQFRIFGKGSVKIFLSKSHLAPSKNNP